MADETILHQDDVEAVIDDTVEAGLATRLAAVVIPDDLTGGQSPTETEHNEALQALRDLVEALSTED